jgi:hypothetical protein
MPTSYATVLLALGFLFVLAGSPLLASFGLVLGALAAAWEVFATSATR